MKKASLLSIAVLSLLLLTTACDKQDGSTYEAQTSIESSTVTEGSDIKPDTTPLFDTANYGEPTVPRVKDALNFEKHEVFDDGEYEFTHTIILPRIDSELPGAVALNKKLLDDHESLASELSASEENSKKLYHITYDHSAYDGIIVIKKNIYTGLYQSEGMSDREYYYYDSVHDTELSSEEYLEHFSLDAEDLDHRARWCANYLFEEDRLYGGVEYYETLLDTDTVVDDISKHDIVFGFAKKSNTPIGYEVTSDTVTVCYRIYGYTSYTTECELNVASGLPEIPLFVQTSSKTASPVGDGSIKLIFDNGRIAQFIASDDIPLVGNAEVTNNALSITYKLGFTPDTPTVYLNGETIIAGQMQMLVEDGDEQLCKHVFLFNRYVSYTELESIEIYFDSSAK